jgi:hypothetical protein
MYINHTIAANVITTIATANIMDAAADERDQLEVAKEILALALEEAGRNNATSREKLDIAKEARDVARKCGSRDAQYYNLNFEDAKKELNQVVEKSQANVAAAQAAVDGAKKALKGVLRAKINGLTALNASHEAIGTLVATATKSAQALEEEKLKNKHEREMDELRRKMDELRRNHAQELADMKTMHNAINTHDKAAATESTAKGASRLAELKKQLKEL